MLDFSPILDYLDTTSRLLGMKNYKILNCFF